MAAFFISTVKVKDPEKMEDYAKQAGATIAAHGGEPVSRGGYVKSLVGAGEPHGVGIVRFPDLAALEAWFASDAYQALVPLREAACDMTLNVYEAPT